VLNADICILPLLTPVLEHGEVSLFKSPLCKRKLCNAVQSVVSGDLAQPMRKYFLPWNVKAFTCILTLYLERTRSPYCLDLTHGASFSASDLSHQVLTRRMNTCNGIQYPH
jgi:hypothetical protein